MSKHVWEEIPKDHHEATVCWCRLTGNIKLLVWGKRPKYLSRDHGRKALGRRWMIVTPNSHQLFWCKGCGTVKLTWLTRTPTYLRTNV